MQMTSEQHTNNRMMDFIAAAAVTYFVRISARQSPLDGAILVPVTRHLNLAQINASDDKHPMAIVSNGTRQDRPVEIIGHRALKARRIRSPIPVTMTRDHLVVPVAVSCEKKSKQSNNVDKGPIAL